MDFGAKVINKLWKASHFEVWWTGEIFFISVQKCLFRIIALNFSLALVSMRVINIQYSWYIPHSLYLRRLNHFFFLLLRNLPWEHLGKFLPCRWCLLWIWLSSDIHFAWITSPFPSGVDTADQYRWFSKLRFHSPTSSQSFSFAKAITFFLNAEYVKSICKMFKFLVITM